MNENDSNDADMIDVKSEADSTEVGTHSWLETSMMVLADDVGIGILALPHCFTKLGLVGGITAIVCTNAISFFTAYLMKDWHTTFDNMLADTFPRLNRTGMKVWVSINYSLCICGYFQASTGIVQGIAYELKFCYYAASFIMYGFMLPWMQFKTLKAALWIMILGMATLVACCVITCIVDTEPYESAPPLNNVIEIFSAINLISFATFGHIMMPEFLLRMKNREEWPKAIGLAYGAQAICYLSFAIAGYIFIGPKADVWILGHLRNGQTWTKIALALMLLHIIIPIIMRTQILIRNVKEDATCPEWFGISFGISLLFLLIINTTPFLDVLIESIVVMDVLAFGIFFPCLIYWLRTESTPTYLKAVLAILMIYAVAMQIFGITAIAMKLTKYYKYISPFTCRAM